MVKYKLLLTGPSLLCFVIFEAFRPTARPLCRGVPFAADEAFVLQSRRALGGDRVGRRAVPQGPTIPGALSSRGCGALVPPACPGDGVPAWRAWGSREEHTWLTVGCSGCLRLEKNGIFFFVTQGVHFKVIWYRREIGRFICWVTFNQGGTRWKMKPRGKVVASVGRWPI